MAFLQKTPSLVLLCTFITLWFTWTNAQHGASNSSYEPHVEYPPYDGFYNNYAHPDWGAAETQLFRRVLPAYSDGTFEPSGGERPNPFNISDAVMNGTTGFPSHRGRTALLVFFGQQVVEEILDAQRAGCPPEYFNIKIPTGHKLYDPDGDGGREMPLLRSRYDMRTGLSPNNPRQQINEISAFMDGTLTYGPNKAWTDAIRSFHDGLLAATNDTDETEPYYPALNEIRLPFANPPPPRVHKLRNIRRFFKIGNPRGNENPFLLTFGILWFRFHNYKARQIKAVYPDWTDERIFNEARKWTIAIHQKIVMYDWLPEWVTLETLPPYSGYDPTIHPGIAHVFQSAAMRFGHTLVPPGVFRRGPAPECNFRMTTKVTGFEGKHGLRTCNVYWTGDEVMAERDNQVDELLMGMASQVTEREDNIITPDLREFVFGPLEFSRRDLMAINIQRARDHGLPDYNTVRQSYGLPRMTSFRDINTNYPSPDFGDVLDRLEEVYHGDIDKLDLWPAGLLETTEAGPGPTFTRIIIDQFRRIRDGDRFWYENYEHNGLFTATEVAEIESWTLRKVILAVTDIEDDDIQMNPFRFQAGDPCPQPFQLSGHNSSHLSECTPQLTYDYFTGSDVPYVLTFLFVGIFLLATIFLLFILAWFNQQKRKKQRTAARKSVRGGHVTRADSIQASEWIGKKEGEREVLISMDRGKKHLVVNTNRGKPLRTIDLKLMMASSSGNEDTGISTVVSIDRGSKLFRLRVPKEYDLVLRFSDAGIRDDFVKRLQDFFREQNIQSMESMPMSEKQIFMTTRTKASRDKLLERFFRVTFAYAFKNEDANKLRALKVDGKEMHDVISCELTKIEFAEALSLKPNSAFVENMFQLVDRNQDGYLSFREFLDVIVIFSKGSAEDKARLLFDMYDLDQSGSLNRSEFRAMLKSMMELANETLEEQKLNDLLKSMTASMSNKSEISFSDFSGLLNDYRNEFNYASLQFDGVADSANIDTSAGRRENAPSRARRTFHRAYQSQADERKNQRKSRVNITTSERLPVETSNSPKLKAIINYIENHRLQIFWLSLYTLVFIGIFAERAYYYSTEREHGGLRRIAGYGVTVTRGAASAMMFTFSCLLVTMCRNTITFLRETFLRHYIPFDNAIGMHKYIAFLGGLSTVTHIIGHSLNFYHIASQTADDLSCIFRNYFHATDELPGFTYWCWGTLTGFTGVLLTLQLIVMYIFATEYSRRNVFKAFWFTHNTYPVFFILMVLHGAGRLVQPPFFHYFFLGPCVLFAIDKLISISRKKVEIAVVRAELLPSDVTNIEFKRPQNFEYKSGQWVRIASLVQSTSEYHPFTLTSAPHEENLSLHIRAVGPWTTNLRRTYDPNTLRENALPRIYLDGPYGEGHQDWHKFDVSVLVGGGIGVTPFASILKDIVNRSKGNNRYTCQKVYFLWVTRTQKQFEWMTDIIRQVEENDSNDLVSVHIFITQFREKFDIRTTMLYICERHFQKISNRSLFTGLRSITHFGRPDFKSFLESLLMEHPNVNMFGVFSCGPPPMTVGVEQACNEVNKVANNGLFVHHFENF